MRNLQWDSLAPASRDFRTFDWSLELDGSTINGTPTATVIEGDVTIISTDTASNIQTVWMTGGTDGMLCRIELSADFADGRDSIPKVIKMFLRRPR
jgi:hypothetical protein